MDKTSHRWVPPDESDAVAPYHCEACGSTNVRDWGGKCPNEEDQRDDES